MVQGVVSYNNMNNMSFPSSAKWSVISLVFLATVVVAPLTWANHESKKSLPNIPGLTFASEGASAPVKPSPVAQNNTGAETDGALAVTIETPAVVVESEDSRGSSQQEQIVAFIKQTFGEDSEDAIAIAKCESGLRPNAINHNTDANQTTDYGVFQINDHWQGVDNTNFLFDYKINILMAKAIFDGRGNWSAWVCAQKLGL